MQCWFLVKSVALNSHIDMLEKRYKDLALLSLNNLHNVAKKYRTLGEDSVSTPPPNAPDLTLMTLLVEEQGIQRSE